MEQVQQNKMGTAPMFKLILSMSLPAMFSMLIQSLYNVVDSYFVAKISENAFTAVSIAAPAQLLMVSVGVGTGVGINSLVSRRLGEGKQHEADLAATHGVLLGLFNWLVFALLGLFVADPFFAAMTDNAEIHQFGVEYLAIVMIASIGVFLQMNLEKTLQATGNMIYPMISQLTGAILNIVLDPIFIFGYFGMPKMGIAGAAIATVVGQIVAACFVLYVSLFKKHRVTISFRNFQFRWKTVKDIYAVGFPSMIMQAIGSVLVAGLNVILIRFSETAVAVYGAYFKLQSFVFMPVFGLNQGVMPIMGYNYGAQNRRRLIKALKIGCLFALCIMCLGAVLFWVFPKQLLLIFEASPQMLEIGVPALRIISLCFPMAALGILFSTLFQATGMGGKSLFISLLRQLICILPVAYLLAQVGGLHAVWYAFPIAETVSLVASVLIFWQLYQKKLQFIPDGED